MNQTTALQVMNTNTLPLGSLGAFIHRAYQIPMLSEEKEHELAVHFEKTGDKEAARALVLPHLRFVIKIARGYLGYGLPFADLIQEGNIGLMKAVKRFNPERGVRLVTFALHWIKAEIHEFILKNWRIVKVATTKAQRKLFFNLRKAKDSLNWLSKSEIKDVAESLNVDEKTVVEMEARMYSHDAAFDGAYDDDDKNYAAPANVLTAGNNDPALLAEDENWHLDHTARLNVALEKLDPRSQDILKRRWLCEKKETLQTLANEYQISAERVRQLEQMALEQLKTQLIK